MELVDLFKNILKVSYAREASVRSIANSKFRRAIPYMSCELLVRKLKLILSKCSLKTLRHLDEKGLLEKCEEVLSFVIAYLKKRGQPNLNLCRRLLQKRCTSRAVSVNVISKSNQREVSVIAYAEKDSSKSEGM